MRSPTPASGKRAPGRHIGRVLAMALVFTILALAGLHAGRARAQARPIVGGIHLVEDPDGMRVRIALSNPLADPATTFALAGPMRIAVDLKNVAASRRAVGGTGPVTAVRVAQFSPDVARVVVDLARPMQVASVAMNGVMLEIRLTPATDAAFAALVKRGRYTVAGATPGAAPAPKPARPAVIVVDAGHGGKDPGAANIAGGSEKDVTLAIARRTRTAIEQRAKKEGLPVRVHLTRDDDRFVTLNGRVALARQWNADLFISIHADSATNADARGASVYTLSDQASDKEAARLAAKENRSDLIAGIDLSDEDREVSALLIDLSMRDSMNASADFAERLQRTLEPKGVPFRSKFHHFAGFRVLKNLGVPAVLLETGYVSNSTDGAFLRSAAGQRAIAEGIADASVAFLRDVKR